MCCSPMDGRRLQIPADIQSLDAMSRRLRGGDTPPRWQIEQRLEQGFGRLMQLEVELQRRRAAAASADAPDPQSVADLRETEEAIDVLRDALMALRVLSGPAGPPRIGYGFVLPMGAGRRDQRPR